MSSEGHYCNYDFGGSDYLSPEEEKRYLEQQHESRARTKQMNSTEVKPKHIELLERTINWASKSSELFQDLIKDINEYLKNPDSLEQALKNAEHRADFLQDLANSHEQGMLERQEKIEALQQELKDLYTEVYKLRTENKKLKGEVSTLQYQKTPRKEVTDYRRVDPDLLVDFAIAALEGGVDYDGFEGKARELQEQIEEKATFHPHVQQEIVWVNGVLRFRMNELVNRLVEEAGNGKGLNYIAGLEASIEDRAQLAQLIGYSVSGYGDLSYSLPVEEDKIPAKEGSQAK